MSQQSKEEAMRFLANVPAGKVFWCHDGSTLQSMADLAKALAGMADETYNFHVNGEKNDFVSWVRDVIGDMKLAADLLAAGNRDKAARQAINRVRTLTKRT
jgi:hypothetical protein